ncbi:MAG: hypothetical protein HYZ50_01130 [Deltaproteobacteria bacterium]|nr:hypothetical protein [Deltaproteobacteria bacterium]
MADKEAERLRYKTEVLKLLVILTIAVGGGSLSLILGELSLLRRVLATVGIIVTFALLLAAWRQHRQIEQLIEQIGVFQ